MTSQKKYYSLKKTLTIQLKNEIISILKTYSKNKQYIRPRIINLILFKMKIKFLSIIAAAGLLTACGPSAEDKSKMEEAASGFAESLKSLGEEVKTQMEETMDSVTDAATETIDSVTAEATEATETKVAEVIEDVKAAAH